MGRLARSGTLTLCPNCHFARGLQRGGGEGSEDKENRRRRQRTPQPVDMPMPKTTTYCAKMAH